MSGKLTALDIRIMLIELEIVERHREHATTHADAVRAVRNLLLRASLSDVVVETEEKP